MRLERCAATLSMMAGVHTSCCQNRGACALSGLGIRACGFWTLRRSWSDTSLVGGLRVPGLRSDVLGNIYIDV